MKNRIIATAQELSAKNQTIGIFPGSVLTMLNPVEAADNNNFSGIDVKLASVLGNEISNIRNNIIPIIAELGKEVNNILGEHINKNLFSDINIITAEIPEAIEGMIERGLINVNGAVTPLSSTSVIIPTPEVSIIRSFIKAGGGQMDKMVKTFASTISDEELTRIWETYLGRITSDNSNYMGLGTRVSSGRYALDLFVLSIIVKNIKTEIPSGVRASNGTYQTVMATLDANLDAKIANLIKNINANIKLGKLILKADGIKEIIVINESYKKFLMDGGEPELIYGAVITGSKTAIVNTLLSNKDKYLKAWNDHVSKETVKNKMATLEQYRMAYRFGLKNVIKNFISEDVKEQIGEDILNNENDILIGYMNSVNYMDLFEVNKVVEVIVCDLLFPNTNAGKFIGYMKHYSKMNNELTAKKAATYASLDLVVDYLMTQIEVK